MPLLYSDAPAHDAGPGLGCFAITPSDSANFTYLVRAIYVGTTGDVVVVNAQDDSTAVKFTSVPAGTILPVKTKRVNSTNTTASNLVGIY